MYAEESILAKHPKKNNIFKHLEKITNDINKKTINIRRDIQKNKTQLFY